ncbi:g11284 [Coccomyxa elongata]
MRFTIMGEQFPDPGDFGTWVTTPMWPGNRPAENLSYSMQAAAIKKYLQQGMKIYVRKVTHIFRVLAARNLDEGGIDDKVIARMGKWNYEAMNKSYLMYFKPVGLLAAAGWPGAAHNDYHQFWHPRFCVDVPEQLVEVLFPFLRTLKKTVEDMGKDATNSMKSVPAALAYLAVCVVQDALEDAAKYPKNPVHALLLASPLFMQLLEQYTEKKLAGSFESMRPMTAAGHMRDMRGFMLQFRELLGSFGAAAAYSPTRDISGGHRGYAAELAEQQRTFRHLHETIQLVGSQQESEDLAEAMEQAALPDLKEPEPSFQRAVPAHDLRLGRSERPSRSIPQAAQAVQPPVSAPANTGQARQAALPAASGAASPPAAEVAQPQLRLDSPNVMTRPFASLLNSAERERHVRHRTAVVENSQYVYVPGIGAIPVAPARVHAAERFSGAALLVMSGREVQHAAAEVAGARAGGQAEEEDAGAGTEESRQPALPQLRTLRSMQQFWKLWHEGDALSGNYPIKDLPPGQRNRRRFSEWKKAADEVEKRVAAMSGSSLGASTALSRVLVQLEKERNKKSMAAFIKALGKRAKPQEEAA